MTREKDVISSFFKMGFVSFFYYYYFSEVDDNRTAVLGTEFVMEEKKGRVREEHKTVGLRTEVGISNTNDKNAKLYTLLYLYSVYVKKGEAW